DLHSGAKNQEPLQLGVRTVPELGVLELVAAVTGVTHTPCLSPGQGPEQIVTPKDAPWSQPPGAGAAAAKPVKAAAAAMPAPSAATEVAYPDTASDLQQRLAALKSAPVPRPAPERPRPSAQVSAPVPETTAEQSQPAMQTLSLSS